MPFSMCWAVNVVGVATFFMTLVHLAGTNFSVLSDHTKTNLNLSAQKKESHVADTYRS